MESLLVDQIKSLQDTRLDTGVEFGLGAVCWWRQLRLAVYTGATHQQQSHGLQRRTPRGFNCTFSNQRVQTGYGSSRRWWEESSGGGGGAEPCVNKNQWETALQLSSE